MAEEAVVVLKAVDEISTPTKSAIASMENLRQTLASMSTASVQAGEAANLGAKGIIAMGEASERSVVPHRAAHQAINLVSMQMAQLAGASSSAHAGIRILDSVLFTLIMTGGAVSIGMTAVIALVGALGAAFSASSEAAKKNKEELEKLVKTQTDAAMSADKLTGAQKQLAALHAGELSREILKVKDQLGDESAKLNDLTTVYDKVTVVKRGLISDEVTHGNATKGTTTDILQQQAVVDALRIKIQDLTNAEKAATQASIGMGAAARAQGEGPSKILPTTTDMMVAEQNVKAFEAKLVAEAQAADKAILASRKTTSAELAKVSTQTAEIIGVATANSAMGVANAWHTAVESIITDIVRMAIQWVEKHIIMAEAAALVHEVSTKGIVGLITGMAAIGAIAAIGAALTAAIGGGGGKSGSGAIGGGASASGAAGAASSGGSAVSSAQQSVTNQIVVNMPVQALDLSSISDVQMKALAFKIGRALQEAGATGQLSLA